MTVSAGGRRVRVAAVVVAGLLLFAGTARGEDDHFPFGPFRMFSRTTGTSGRVVVGRVEGFTADGHRVRFDGAFAGLRRAELEGQLRYFAADPEELRHLAEGYARAHPGASELVGIHVYNVIYRLRDNRVVGRDEETVARWGST